jgi:hypothetical protein
VFEDAASDHYEVKFDECLAVSTAHHNHLPLPAIKEKFQHFILLTIKKIWSRRKYIGTSIVVGMISIILPCIADHETYIRQAVALDLQGKDHRSPLFQTSLSPREAVGGRQTAFSRTTHDISQWLDLT